MAHRHSSFQLLLLVALVLLVAQYPAEAQADYSALATELEPELEHNISIADFGIARRINHLADFGHAVTRSVTPTVLFSFDSKEQGESVDVWSFFIRNIAHATEKWGIPVLYTTINTEVGVALPYSYRLPSKQSILMFNNDMTAVNGSLTLWKVPTYFSGSLDLVKVLQWILESISHSAIERINNEHELIDYFDKYNDLTMLPHVLFFTLRNYTSPVYKIVSQRLSMNAAFGVVVDALSTPEKRDIAARYNLTKPEDFPAVLALHKLGGDTDDVHRMPNVTSDTTHEELTEFLADELDVEFSFEFYEPWNSRSKLQQFQMYMTQENDRLQALLMEESMQEGGQRITNVTTEEEWREGCLKSDRGHCLVIFANKKKQAEVTEILRDSAKRMRELAPENTTRQQIDFAILEPSRSKAIMKFFRSTKSDLVLIETAPTFRFLRYEGSLSSSTVAHLLFTRTEESAHGWVEATLDEVPELGTAAPRERRSRRGAAAREEPASPGDGELDL